MGMDTQRLGGNEIMARPSVEEARKTQILSATRRVVVQRGLATLRVADVAEEAGLSSGIIHYYFDGKEDLLREMFEDNFATSLRRRSSVLNKDIPADEKLNLILQSYIPRRRTTYESWHIWLELWTGALQDPELRKLNETAYGAWRDIVKGIISDGIAQGIFAVDSLDSVVNQLVGMLDGLAMQTLVGSATLTAEEMEHAYAEFVKFNLLKN
jgi:AcrR family transcriptional regulator